ncbi:MAG: response regulator, partial [Candidatus Riflemargulisbacteria bacterium]
MLRMRNKIIADKKKISLSSLPTIMIVDDDKQLSKSFEAILDIYGYPVLKVAHSVDEAIMFMEACKDKEARPQIIMTDYHMGVKTGADLLRWIKKNYEMWKETRTILISGGAKKEEILEAGAHISLEKPVRIEELIGSLFELVPHKID